MRWVGRHLHGVLREASRAFPVVVLTGPRRAGKTALLRRLFPKAAYQLLESPDLVARVRADPRGWLEAQTTPIILDEIQHAPELLPYIRASVDAAPGKKGRWLITGSQDFSLMQGVTESMAGRAAVLTLLPLSAAELGRVDLLRGGYPEVWARPRRKAGALRGEGGEDGGPGGCGPHESPRRARNLRTLGGVRRCAGAHRCAGCSRRAPGRPGCCAWGVGLCGSARLALGADVQRCHAASRRSFPGRV